MPLSRVSRCAAQRKMRPDTLRKIMRTTEKSSFFSVLRIDTNQLDAEQLQSVIRAYDLNHVSHLNTFDYMLAIGNSREITITHIAQKGKRFGHFIHAIHTVFNAHPTFVPVIDKNAKNGVVIV